MTRNNAIIESFFFISTRAAKYRRIYRALCSLIYPIEYTTFNRQSTISENIRFCLKCGTHNSKKRKPDVIRVFVGLSKKGINVDKPLCRRANARLKTSGRFAHKAYAHEHDFAVFGCDLRIVDSRLIVDMRHIKFHFLFPLQAAYIFVFSLACKHMICYTVYRNRYIKRFL